MPSGMYELVVGLAFEKNEHKKAADNGRGTGQEKAAGIFEAGVTDAVTWAVSNLEKNLQN